MNKKEDTFCAPYERLTFYIGSSTVSSLLVSNTYFHNREDKTMAQTSKYKRVVLKLSGEALAGEDGFG